MPCVKCSCETPNGWRFCKPCIEIDMAEKKMEELKNRQKEEFDELSDDNLDMEYMHDFRDDRHNIKNELKELNKKVNKLESLIKETYDDLYVLLSKDEDNLIHLHGIFSNIENANSSYEKIEQDSNRYSKIIKLKEIVLYKTQLDKLDNSFDTSLFDDCDMDIIKIKEFKENKIESI